MNTQAAASIHIVKKISNTLDSLEDWSLRDVGFLFEELVLLLNAVRFRECANFSFLQFVFLFFQEGLEGRVTVKQYMKQYKTLLGEYLPLTSLLPGALRLVRHLTAHKIPLAICTGSDTYEFHMKMKNQKELLDLVPLRVSICQQTILR